MWEIASQSVLELGQTHVLLLLKMEVWLIIFSSLN